MYGFIENEENYTEFDYLELTELTARVGWSAAKQLVSFVVSRCLEQANKYYNSLAGQYFCIKKLYFLSATSTNQ